MRQGCKARTMADCFFQLPLAYACAKVNLTLHITGRRADGYHLLESLVAFASPDSEACDQLTLSPGLETKFSVSGTMATTLNTADNLVTKAANMFMLHFPQAVSGHFQLTKVLPVSAGIGGGSADAAAALRLLANLNKIQKTDPRLQEIARELGADVLMCLMEESRFVKGIGDDLGPVLKGVSLPVVLINPGIPVSTPDVFRRAAFLENTMYPEHQHPSYPDSFTQQALIDFLRQSRNDLEPAAMVMAPVIRDVIDVLYENSTCLLARMSGSGATVFGVFPTLESASCAARGIQTAHPQWWVVPTMLQ